jgi:hypothetical protein
MDSEFACIAAYRARRLFVSSNSSATPFMLVIAMILLALPRVHRVQNRRDFHTLWSELLSVPNLSFAASILCTAIVAMFGESSDAFVVDDFLSPSLQMAFLLLSVPLAITRFHFFACVLAASGLSLHLANRAINSVISWEYLTFHLIIASLAMIVIVGIASIIIYALYVFENLRLVFDALEKVISACTTALFSIQLFLLLTTTGMSSGFSGAEYLSDGGNARRAGGDFTVQHTLCFFFSAALFATRFEHAHVRTLFRRILYYTSVALPSITWAIVLATSQQTTPYTSYVDTTSFFVGVSSAVVVWGVVGFLIIT